MEKRYLEALRRQFRDTPQRVFCRQIAPDGAETPLTWADLEGDCAAMAGALRAAGAPPSGEVMIFLRHRRELYGAFFGAMLGGWAPAFMPCPSAKQDPQLYWSAHAELFRRLRPAAVITDGDTLAGMRAAGLDLGDAVVDVDSPPRAGSPAPTPARPGSETAFIQHSSGTTGLKKGVALSFDAVADQIDAYAASIEAGPKDVIVSWLPLYHDMGLMACLPACRPMLGIGDRPYRPVHLARSSRRLLLRCSWPSAGRDAVPGCPISPSTTWRRWLAVAKAVRLRPVEGARLSSTASEILQGCVSFDRFLAAVFANSGVRPDQPSNVAMPWPKRCSRYRRPDLGVARRVERLRVDRPTRWNAVHVPCARSRRRRGVATTLLEAGHADCHGIARGRSWTTSSAGCCQSGTVGEIGIRRRPFCSQATAGRSGAHGRSALKDGTYFNPRPRLRAGGPRLSCWGAIDDLIIVNGRNLYAHRGRGRARVAIWKA